MGLAAGGVAGAVVGGLLGGITGGIHGWAMASAETYDWSSIKGWAQFLIDNTWSLPNSLLGSVFATANIGWNPISSSGSKHTGSLVFQKNWFSGYDTTIGNVIVGTSVLKHERIHAFQARLFGPLFYPLFLVSYAVNTVAPYWFAYHDFSMHPFKTFTDYFRKGVYPHTWFEEWAYSIAGSPP
jgi:hypothetical protein